MSGDAWLDEHKGEYIDTVAEIWDCWDNCGCTRPLIVERYRNLKSQHVVVRIFVWEGTFRTEGEPGAEEELAAKRAEMERDDPEAAARITWPAATEGDNRA